MGSLEFEAGVGSVYSEIWVSTPLANVVLRLMSRIGPPNKIQARVLPFMLKGSDLIAQAPPTQERIIS
jgi:translation initiation factor 4A